MRRRNRYCRRLSTWSVSDGDAHFLVVSCHPAVRAFAFAVLAGCGLDLGGAQFVSIAGPPSGGALDPSVEATDASSPAASNEGVADAGAAFDLDVGLIQQGDASPDAVSPALEGVAPDASADVDLLEAVAVQDGATKDGGDDGGTPCDRLMRCCQSLVAPPPPALFVCSAGAQRVDGGDAGSCDSLLASLEGTGLCP